MTKKLALKRTLYSLLIIAICYGLYRAGEKAYRLYEKTQITKEMAEHYQEFANICLNGIDRENHDLVLDILRDCVHKNSEHNIDDEFYAITHNAKSNIDANRTFTEEVIKYAQEKRDTKPHLECSKRARTLVSLYSALGYDARHIRVTKYTPNFSDHVLVEVRNPAEGNWEVQDPSFNTHFLSIKSGEKLNMLEIIRLETTEIIPCSLNNNCGWKIHTHDGHFHTDKFPLYSGIAYLGSYNDFGRGPLIYNPNKFPINDPIIHNGEEQKFCDFHSRQCKKVINVLEEDYSYEGVNPVLF